MACLTCLPGGVTRAAIVSFFLCVAPAQAAPMMGAPAQMAAASTGAVLAQLEQRRKAAGFSDEHGYQIVSQHPGLHGTHVLRAAHLYKGVPIFGSDSTIVVDAGGQVVSESASGRRALLGKTGVPAATLAVTPAITRLAALRAAMRALGGSGTHASEPQAQLVIYPMVEAQRVPGALHKAEAELNALDVADTVTGYRLAWHVALRMQGRLEPRFEDMIVDAATGRILARWPMLQTVRGVGNSQYDGQVPLSTTQEGGQFLMRDPERGRGGQFGALAVTNANHGTSFGAVYTNSTNTWGDGQQFIDGGSTTGPNGQTAAVNAMWGLMNTYDLLRNVLGWHSLDGQDTATHIAVHVRRRYDNAYYSDTCRCMFIGDGSVLTNLASLDVVGHEMGHGVTASTSNLVYAGESGGLNESSSDILGEVVEAYARAGSSGDTVPEGHNDWMLGRDISPGDVPLRYMAKPSRDGRSRDAWGITLRFLDVHYSSGPNNRMFYFLANGSSADPAADNYSRYLVRQPGAMRGIGIDKAFRLWFAASTTRFTSSTNYAQARSHMLATAEQMYGAGSPEAVAVQRAYAAINVGDDVDEVPAPVPVAAPAPLTAR